MNPNKLREQIKEQQDKVEWTDKVELKKLNDLSDDIDTNFRAVCRMVDIDADMKLLDMKERFVNYVMNYVVDDTCEG